MLTAPPQDLDAELSVLGGVILAPSALLSIVNGEPRLRAEDFYRESHSVVFQAMVDMATRGDGIDELTLTAELDRTGKLEAIGGRATVQLLAGSVPAIGNFHQYAARVVEMKRWRQRLEATFLQMDAIERYDATAYDDASRVATARDGSSSTGLLSPEDLGSRWFDAQHADTSAKITTPWDTITDALFDGLTPGDTTIIAAWSGMGKTSACDQLLDHAHRVHGSRCCVYVNEMSDIDRTSRLLSGRAGVPFERLQRRTMTPDDARKVMAELGRLPYWMQPCAGWSADAIARSILHHKWDLALLDMATRLPYSKTAEWDRASGILTDAARQAGTHLLMTVQLNRERATSPVRPMPVLRDLRNTGAWENDARNVLLIHRREELDSETGLPITHDDGLFQLAKVSNGKQGVSQRVFLKYRSMRFLPLVGEDAAQTPAIGEF